MIRRTFIIIPCVIVGGMLSLTGGARDIPIPEKWDTLYAWFLVTNPEYVPASQEKENALTSAHIQYQLRLQEENRSIVAGGLGEGADDSIVGLTILRADSLAGAVAIAGADPAVRAGRFISRVREWWVPAGRLP